MASDSDDEVPVVGGAGGKKLGPHIPHLEKEVAAIKKALAPNGKKASPAGVEEESDSDDDEGLTSVLAKKFQVSLDDEKNVKELEDPDLVQHMADARVHLAELEKKYSDIPSETELAGKYTQTLRTLSASITSLTEKSRGLQTQAERMHLESSNASKLSKGEQPHGYPVIQPKLPRNAAALQKLSDNVENIAKATEKIYEELTALRNGLTVMRREYEFVVDKQKRTIEHHSAARQILMASRS